MIRVRIDPEAGFELAEGEMLVDCCNPSPLGLFQSDDVPTRAIKFEAWLADAATWNPPVQTVIASVNRAHRRGQLVALRCWCRPDRYHAAELKALVEALTTA